MPGPKMGARPPDFNEASLKQSPTYIKWLTLPDGEKLRYACREFIKGHENDDERLLRRIMIARRNNIRDHETLKVARQRANVTTIVNTTAAATTVPRSSASERNHLTKTEAPETTTTVRVESNVVDQIPVQETQNHAEEDTMGMDLEPEAPTTAARTRRPPHTFSDAQIEQEMDVAAVMKTRSYRSWLEVPDGGEFVVRVCVCV